MSQLEVGDGGQNPLGTPCPLLAPGAEAPEGRLVKVRVISVPGFGAVAVELSGGKCLPVVVPGD